MDSEDILKKMQNDLSKRMKMQEEFFDETNKVMWNKAVMESMASALRESMKINRQMEEKAEGQKRTEQYRREDEPDINKYIVEFINCELDIISGFEMSGDEKKTLEAFDQKIADEKKKINNKGGLSKLFSRNKDKEIEEKIAQLSKEKQKEYENIKGKHIKRDTASKERRKETLEKISSHPNGFEGLSILSDLFEGYSEQLSENKKELADKINQHNERAKEVFSSSLSIVESMVEDSSVVTNTKKEKIDITRQVQLLVRQSDEIESVRKILLDKIIERPEEDIESSICPGTKKIVKQTIGELANTKAVMQYQDFKKALKDRKRINGHTISDEDIRQQFEML